MITQTTVRPSVWIGCLPCYNQGLLNGKWFPAEEAGEVTPDDLHQGPTYHDELWCFDHEGFPRGTGEMSPDTAQLWSGPVRNLLTVCLCGRCPGRLV